MKNAGRRANAKVITNRNGKDECTAILCKNGIAISQLKSDKNPMSKLINPRPTEKDFNSIGQGISNVMVSAVKICSQP